MNEFASMHGLSIWHWLVVIVVLALTAATGVIAARKKRSVAGWVILGLLFNPVALVVLLSLPSDVRDGDRSSLLS